MAKRISLWGRRTIPGVNLQKENVCREVLLSIEAVESVCECHILKFRKVFEVFSLVFLFKKNSFQSKITENRDSVLFVFTLSLHLKEDSLLFLFTPLQFV